MNFVKMVLRHPKVLPFHLFCDLFLLVTEDARISSSADTFEFKTL